jgi:predicted P-loop ATPase
VTRPEDGVELVKQALQRSPNVNLAILLGTSGLLVADLDVKQDQGIDGIEEFVKLSEGKNLPEGPMQITGGGGRHLFFSIPIDKALQLPSKRDVAPGVELKSASALIHVYPSMHVSGNTYTWAPQITTSCMPPDAPEWLVALAGERRDGSSGNQDVPVTREELRKLAKKWAGSARISTGRDGRILTALLDFDPADAAKTGPRVAEVLPDGSRLLLLSVMQALAKPYLQVLPERVLAPLKAAIEWRTTEGGGTKFEEVIKMFRDAQVKLRAEKSGWRQDLNFHRDTGAITNNAHNIYLILANHRDWEGVLAFNERRNRAVFLKEPPFKTYNSKVNEDVVYPQEIEEHEVLPIISWFYTREGVLTNKLTVLDALFKAARQRQAFDPVRDYFENLSWDGTPRLDDWLSTYGNAASNPYIKAIGAKTLLSAVARTYEPGCKADHVLILEGPQGVRKSTLLATLCPEKAWFTDHLPDLNSKDAMLQLSGKLIIEISELSAVKKSAQERVKSFLTSPVDTYRPPYGRIAEDFPRRSIFVGSTNEEFYMVDNTGNRRYWPVKLYSKIPQAKIDQLVADRDQLWAEAVARYKRGEDAFLNGEFERIAKSEQSKREEAEIDPWLDLLREVLAEAKITTKAEAPVAAEKAPEVTSTFSKLDAFKDRLDGKHRATICDGFVSTTDLLAALEVDKERQHAGHARRLRTCMRRIGWETHRPRYDGPRGFRRRQVIEPPPEGGRPREEEAGE